ncbi:lytic transglycosylase domain-containing protein [Candidatus Woesearchaeota archaeon]|nr:lytic transglycosylase domain-containing protein [Candidatus Woesearchaeota archaeon]
MEVTRRGFLGLVSVIGAELAIGSDAQAQEYWRSVIGLNQQPLPQQYMGEPRVSRDDVIKDIRAECYNYKTKQWKVVKQMLPRVARYGSDFLQARDTYQISEYYLAGFCAKESDGYPFAVSSAGALGLMQVMPKTARTMGYSPRDIMPHDYDSPAQQRAAARRNVLCGAKYLAHVRDEVMKEYPYLSRSEKGDLMIAAYYTGMGGVNVRMDHRRSFAQFPQDSGTYKYVIRVNALTKIVEENARMFGFNAP